MGFIHDIGKILFLWGCDKDGTSLEEQWGMVGDTFIVGCQLPDSLVFPEFNNENPDMKVPLYNTKFGIYPANCGLDNVICSWSHDEYLYQILKHNKSILPPEALYIIRFHSLYAYHDKGEYTHLMNEKDHAMLPWVKIFNKYDLYTKSDNICTHLKDYYLNLAYKYIGTELTL